MGSWFIAMRRSHTLRIVAVLSAVLPGLALRAESAAQTVEGRVLDGRTREPVLLVAVSLADSAANVLDRTFTDERGQFTLRAPRPGSYHLAAVRNGYAVTIDGPVRLEAGADVTVEFYMRPEVMLLDSIFVEAGRGVAHQRLAETGFYVRADKNFGYFVTPEMINRRPLSGFEDLFRLKPVPGLRTFSGPLGVNLCYSTSRPTLESPNCRPNYCEAVVYVDGMRVLPMADTTMVATDQRTGSLDQFISIDDVAAMEVYRGGATVPLEWGGTEAECAVVILWSRK